jgi:hypothetical protein
LVRPELKHNDTVETRVRRSQRNKSMGPSAQYFRADRLPESAISGKQVPCGEFSGKVVQRSFGPTAATFLEQFRGMARQTALPLAAGFCAKAHARQVLPPLAGPVMTRSCLGLIQPQVARSRKNPLPGPRRSWKSTSSTDARLCGGLLESTLWADECRAEGLSDPGYGNIGVTSMPLFRHKLSK